MKPGDYVVHGSVMGRIEQVDRTPGRPDRVLVNWRRSWIDGEDLKAVEEEWRMARELNSEPGSPQATP
jgi:hypothetical protein